jgi:hypothetical protein
MALSPLVALAEQASNVEVAHAVLLVRTVAGERAMYPMEASDPDVLGGLMAWGTAVIYAEIPDDDDE